MQMTVHPLLFLLEQSVNTVYFGEICTNLESFKSKDNLFFIEAYSFESLSMHLLGYMPFLLYKIL